MKESYNDDIRSQLRARLKKEIIQNNIYGVDIEEGAIEIARLRFWLSIVIDLDKPEALPNFDYKFMQGNSLLESTMLPGTKKPFNLNIQEMMNGKFIFPGLKHALKQLHNELNHFYGETDHIKKQASRKAIKEHVIEVLKACVDDEPTKVQEIAEIAAKTKDDFTCTDFFLWHTWFADVFGLNISEDSVAVSNKEGFDIVIGNPPYIGLGGDLNKIYSPYKYVKPKQSANKRSTVTAVDAVYKFKTHDGNGDIYCLFYEWGRELLKENGHLCYITSNKWMRTGYGAALRDLLATETNPMILIDFGGVKVFENATVDVNILLCEKTDKNTGSTWCTDGGSDAEVLAAYRNAKGLSPDTKDVSITEKIQYFLADYMYRGATVMKFNSSKSWIISSSSIFEQIKTKVESVGTPLRDWNIRINRGILTGCNDAFIIDTAKRNEILNACKTVDERQRTEALIRPILRGKDIKRYGYAWAGKWLIYIPWHFPLQSDSTITGASVKAEAEFQKQYPAVYDHLLGYKTELSQRNQAETGIRYEWYALQRWGAKYLNDFDLPKIMYSEIVKEPQFYYDPNGSFYPEATTFIMSGAHLDYLYRLFHTHAVTYFFKTYYAGGGLNSDGYRYKKAFLINLPIPLFINTPLQQEIVNTPTANTKQIDALVYELYGITSYDELLEIEGNPSSALQMLILIHIHQHPADTETQMIAVIQDAIASLNNPNLKVSNAEIQAAIDALVNDKVIDYTYNKNFTADTPTGLEDYEKVYVWFQYMHRYSSEKNQDENFATRIETIDDFATLQQRLCELNHDTSKNFIYRGVNNAAYMMYSSAQRGWLNKHTTDKSNDKAGYIAYINSLIGGATPIVRPYLLKNNIPDNEIEILALMQHYESVSPFVDFSTCIYKALFFAFDNAECSKAGGLDDYVALYYVSSNDLKKDLQNLYQEAAEIVQKISEQKSSETNGVNCEKIKGELEKLPLDKIKDLTHIMVSGNTTTHLEIPAVNFVTENTITSMRQMNQNGLFIANLLPNIPLVELINLVGKSGNNIFHCIHISKKLKDEVLKWLKGYGIDKQNLYKDKNQDLLKALKDLGKQDI